MVKTKEKAVLPSLVRFIESRQWPGPIIVLAAIAAAHLTFINNGFIWLEHGDLEQGRALLPLSRWWLAFTQPYGFTGFYRPFVTLLHSLDAAVWGSAAGFHITNIALHCAAALAVPLFIGAFFPLSRVERCIVALIFGLHPLALLPAGGISFRSESLLVLFVSLAVWSYTQSRKSVRWQWPATLAVTALSACFSKETSFFYLPLFCGLWELYRVANRNPESTTSKGVARFLIPVIIAAGALGSAAWLRSAAMPVSWVVSPPQLTLVQGIGMRLLVLGRQLVNLLSPLPPVLSDVVPMVGLHQAVPLLMIAVVAIAITLMVRAGVRSPMTMVMLLVTTALLPGLDILPLPRFYSPHYAYLAVAPMAGGVVLLVRWWRGKTNRQIGVGAYGLVAVWLAVAAGSTAGMGSRFNSDLTFFKPEVDKDPRFSEAWFYIGNYYKAERNFEAADSAYDRGLSPAPGVVRFFDPLELLINKSSVAVQQDRLPAADSMMLLAQASSPAAMQPNIAFIRADIAGRMGRYDTVIALLYGREENLQRPETCRLLATALARLGREKEAEEMEERGRSLEAQPQ